MEFPEELPRIGWQLIVGNVGTVLQTFDKAEAEAAYHSYVADSMSVKGIVGGEAVTLFECGEPILEYSPPEPASPTE